MQRITKEDEAYLRKLEQSTRGYHPSEFVKEVAEIAYEAECTRRFKLMCKDLKDVGYEILWVGENPHSTFLNSNGCLIAEPKRVGSTGTEREWTDCWPSIWRISERYFPTSCGNGLSNADQRQLSIFLPQSLAGKHIL